MFKELAVAIYLQAGFQKWERAATKGLLRSVNATFEHRAAFLGGAMFGQNWAAPVILTA